MSADGKDLLLARFKLRGSFNNCVAWSPDGNLLAVGTDRAVTILTVQGDQHLHLYGHNELVLCVAFAPGGKRIASGSYDKTVRLWSIETGKELQCLRGHHNSVRRIAFAANGKTVTAVSSDSTCHKWQSFKGDHIAEYQLLDTWIDDSIAVTADGRNFGLFSRPGVLLLWNTGRNTSRLHTFEHQGMGRPLAFSPDSTTLATDSADNTIRLWKIETGMALSCFNSHTDRVGSVAFSPDGRRLASVSDDGTLCLWDTSNLAALCAKPLADSPLSTWLARQTATLGCIPPPALVRDGWVPQLPGADGQHLLAVLKEESTDTIGCSVTLSQDGYTLYRSTIDGRVQAWNLRIGEMLWAKHCHTRFIHNITLSPNGVWLASASHDATIRLWDAESGQEHWCLKGSEGRVFSVAFSPDGMHLASGGEDRTIHLWELATGRLVATMTGHKHWVQCIAFSADGYTLASASNDGSIRLWDYHSGRQTAILHQHSQPVYAIAFPTDDASLVFADEDGAICMRYWTNNPQSPTFTGHRGRVNCLAFSRDGTRLASGEWLGERTIKIWDTGSGAELQKFAFPESECKQIAWSGNGAFLAAGLGGDTVRIFDTRSSLSSAAPPTDPSQSLRLPTPLPQIWTHLLPHWQLLQQLQIAAPLSLLLDLQALLAKDTPPCLQALANHPGLNALQRLNWPAQARLGILALLLNQWPGSSEWQTPPDMSIAEARQSLEDALSHATPCEPAQPAPPLAWLTQSLNQGDERLLPLLTALGPQAVANDPGLPLRLLPQIANLSHMTHMTQIRRQSLGQTLASLESGPAQSIGTGLDRAGLSVHEAITALVPSQWAYPSRLLHWQHLNGGLLYRTRIVRKLPQLRPMVILLDTSPACWGLIEALTRPAAYALAETLASQQLPAMLLTTGDNQVRYLNQPAERLQLFTHRSQQPVDIQASLAKAHSLCRELADGKTEPIILLLTHCWLGAESGRSSAHIRQQSLRALFVQYSKTDIHPPFADQCERWETLHHNQFNAVTDALIRLIG